MIKFLTGVGAGMFISENYGFTFTELMTNLKLFFNS